MIRPIRQTCILASTRLDRLALSGLVRNELRMRVSSQCAFIAVDIWSAMREEPDLALVNADQASLEVRDCLQMISRLRAETRILVLSGVIEVNCLRTWADCPLNGYVFKDGGLDELKTAIESLRRGEKYYSPGTEGALNRQSPDPNRPHLSPREMQLLPLLAQGMKLREAATKMTVSYKTADAYRTSLLKKLGMHDRVELVRYAIREGIVHA